MDNITIQLTIADTDAIQRALEQYIDYLKDGDKSEKRYAVEVEQVYDKFYKQIKWG